MVMVLIKGRKKGEKKKNKVEKRYIKKIFTSGTWVLKNKLRDNKNNKSFLGHFHNT